MRLKKYSTFKGYKYALYDPSGYMIEDRLTMKQAVSLRKRLRIEQPWLGR